MSLQENKNVVRHFYGKKTLEETLAALDEVCDNNMVYYGTGGIELHGLETFKKVMKASVKAFPDMEVTMKDIVAEGDKVATREEAIGTHLGEHSGMAPTGKRLTWWAMQICRIEGGKVKEMWRTEDRTTQIRAASSS